MHFFVYFAAINENFTEVNRLNRFAPNPIHCRHMKGLILTLQSSFGGRMLFTVAIACALLIFASYFSTQVNSAIRAYVHGESEYSKGQKDATKMLIFYVLTGSESHYEAFEKSIAIPLSDGRARRALQSDAPDEVVREAFLAGNNHPDDIDRMVWLFRWFDKVGPVKKSISLWTEADAKVEELHAYGIELHERPGKANAAILEIDNSTTISRIREITAGFTQKQRAFSDNLGDLARLSSGILFFINLALILIIIGSLGAFYRKVINELEVSRIDLKIKNDNLLESNKKLDQFLYASSHDLKSPINNLEGLIEILEMVDQTEPALRTEVISKMRSSIHSLQYTIGDIENLMRVGRLSGSPEDMGNQFFNDLLDQIITDNEVSFEMSTVSLHRDFQIESIEYSRIGLKSILFNLLSNACKYRSQHRQLEVHISTFLENGALILLFADNGSGLDMEQYGSKLFTMFRRFHSHVPGSGLGLYGVREIVERHGGHITVDSKVEEGAVFRIVLSK